MSRTLFFYIFNDLFRYFILTAAALAGIMSFGGLLRPLTEHGLGVGQVARMLAFFLPAMTTYSLPIAALFATTLVYGRLSADNELTAVRASGISYLSISFPAFILGATVAALSVLLLCFIVPACSLRVERTIYSNLAQLIANQIERKHEVRFDRTGDRSQAVNVYADSAYLPDPDPAQPAGQQRVVLVGPTIISYDSPRKDDPRFYVPKEFFLARQATVFVTQPDQTDEAMLEIRLDGGSSFPRLRAGKVLGGIEAAQVGPVPLPSLIGEQTKFMDYFTLREVLRDPGKSRRVRSEVDDFVREDQERNYLEHIAQHLAAANSKHTFETGGTVNFTIERAGAGWHEIHPDGLHLITDGTARGLRVREARADDGQVTLSGQANRIIIRAIPDMQTERIHLVIDLQDAIVNDAGRTLFRRDSLSVPMPAPVRLMHDRLASHYLNDPGIPAWDRARLQRQWWRITNGAVSELHSRAAFAVSCLILVMVGCSLGMMFKSGNFLSAFAVSVVPAMLCIMLIVTGQHTCENVPWDLTKYANPLPLGLTLIWSGNAAVLAIAIALMWRLQRQ